MAFRPALHAAVLDHIRGQLEGTQVSAVAPALRVSFSAGVAVYQGQETIASTIDRADQALYEAKAAGRARTEMAESALPTTPSPAQPPVAATRPTHQPSALDGAKPLPAQQQASAASANQSPITTAPTHGSTDPDTAEPPRFAWLLGAVALVLALAAATLAAPANQITLRLLESAPLPHRSASLLPPGNHGGGCPGGADDPAPPGEALHQLLERLSARLGPEQVQCVALVADHRPECMQRWQPASQALAQGGAVAGSQGQGGGLPASGPCALQAPDASLWPTWLLRPPQRLSVQGSRPCYQGPLRLLAGPHRLEAAWWEAALSYPPADSAHRTDMADMADGPDAAGSATPSPAPGLVVRDYFVAHNERAGHVWVYRERLPQTVPSAQAPTDAGMPTRQDRWFLHGIYG